MGVKHFILDPGAPIGAQIDPGTGTFTWKPTVPGTFMATIRVSDGQSHTLEGFETITVSVNQDVFLPLVLQK